MATEEERKNYRLSRDVWPTRYVLALDLDLEAWGSSGKGSIGLRLLTPQQQITLHSVDLEITQAAVRGAAAKVSYDTVAETATLTLGRELPAGEHTLDLAWRGPIAERLRGLYRSTRPGERYAATQFEVTDARRAFPCFDEPEYKATFALELVHPSGIAALANMPTTRTEPTADGRTLTRFAETPKISSYLVAFTVGPYQSTPEARTATGWPVRVWAPPGLAEKGGYARDAHVKSLQWLEAYTGLPYPYTKVDAIGIPDFEAGAMENPGAITYRTTYIAADPSTATMTVLKATFSVAAHELTHMWWGDLVTMKWWNDLWLNESFASFIGEKATAALNPEWNYLRDFVAENERAFGMDALATTHPISVEAKNAEEAAERFDSISYIKGQAVLRMIENYVGEDAFQKGVRIYLNRHREANATADDFWHAIDEASARSITAIANSWIKEPGFPLLRCDTTVEPDGLSVTFTQERFYADPALPSGDQRWSVPLVITYSAGGEHGVRASGSEERVLFDGTTTTVRLPGARWYYPNAGGAGFYRTLLDDEAVKRLAGGIAKLSVTERLALLNNQWALTMASKANVTAYLRLVAALEHETDRTVLGAMAGALGWISSHALDDALRPRFEKLVERIFRRRLEKLGWDVRPDESSDDREERSQTLGILGRVARAADVRTESRRRIDAHLGGATPLPADALQALVGIAAEDGDTALWEKYDARRKAVATTDTQEESRFRFALGDFRDPAIAERTARTIFSDAVRAQDRPLMLGRLMSNRAARAVGWKVIKENWDAYVPAMEAGLKQNLMAALSQLTAPDLAKEAIAWLEKKATSDMKAMSGQTIERLRLASANAARVRSELAAALDAIRA